MFSITSSDVIKKPSYVTQPKEVTFVEDAKRHVIKSVILPYELYEKIREKLEDEIYLMQNREALSQKSYENFLEIEDAAAEDLQ